MSGLKKTIIAVISVLSLLLFSLLGTTILYFNEISTSLSVKLVSSKDTNVYYSKVEGDYYFSNFISAKGASHTNDLQKFLNIESSKGFISFSKTNINETSFELNNMVSLNDNSFSNGLKYFNNSSNIMIVETSPSTGYSSISTVDLEKLGVDSKLSFFDKTISIPSVYLINDGINEKGLSVSLNYTSKANENIVYYNTSNCDVTESVLLRLILDNCSTTEQAINLLNDYDLYLGTENHISITITDINGNCVVISTQDDFYIDQDLLKVTCEEISITSNSTSDELLNDLSNLSSELSNNYIKVFNSTTKTIDYYFNNSTEVSKSFTL